MATSNTTPIVIPQPIAAQATSENINVIPNGATGTNLASFQEGFPAITRMPVIENPLPTQQSGLPPKQQDFNGLFNAVSQHTFFAQNGGMYSFNQAVSDAISGYPKNAVLWYFPENEDPCLVYSLINDNTNNFVEDPTLIDGEHWKKLSLGGVGEIGDIGFAPLGIDESLNLRRYLNGQVIIQSQFVAFTNKVKAAIALFPSLSATEENWQAEKTNSKLGQCGKFVVDDTAGTIRLPAVVNAQGLADLALIGVIKSESLPNWYAKFGNIQRGVIEGAATWETFNSNPGGGTGERANVRISPSISLPDIYKDGAPVQQEAVQYPYYIVVNTGVEEAERPINNYQVNNVYSYGMSQYYKGTMNNNSWLRSQGQWNDGTVYTGMYNWLLEQMNAGVSGFVASTAAYTDYDFVINTADQTFRLPLKAELDAVPSGWNLYYYVGDTLQNADLINVARIEETITDLSARRYVTETWKSGTSWYRVWSDGWIEQGGSTGLQGENSYTRTTVTFLKPFKDTNYIITNAPNKYSTQNGLSPAYPPFIYTKNTNTCVFGGFCWSDGFDWYACGY